MSPTRHSLEDPKCPLQAWPPHSRLSAAFDDAELGQLRVMGGGFRHSLGQVHLEVTCPWDLQECCAVLGWGVSLGSLKASQACTFTGTALSAH